MGCNREVSPCSDMSSYSRSTSSYHRGSLHQTEERRIEVPVKNSSTTGFAKWILQPLQRGSPQRSDPGRWNRDTPLRSSQLLLPWKRYDCSSTGTSPRLFWKLKLHTCFYGLWSLIGGESDALFVMMRIEESVELWLLNMSVSLLIWNKSFLKRC